MTRRRPSAARCTAGGSAPGRMRRRCSFYPTKTLGCYGDGGALLTDDADRAELYRSLRTHGEGKTRYEVQRTGMNGRLDTIQAAILLAKLPLLEEELAAAPQARRRPTTRRWPARSACRAAPAGAESAWGLYTIRCRTRRRARGCRRRCRRRACPARIYYPKPLHHQPAYAAAPCRVDRRRGPPPLPVSEALCDQVLSLPMHPYLTEAEAARVAAAVLAGL